MQVPIRYPKKNLLKRFFSIDNHFFSILIGLIFAGIFCTSVYVFATTYLHNPGDTLNPTDCNPGDLNCITPPATYSFGANNFSGSGNFTTTGTGSFGYFQLGSSTTSGYVLTANASGTGTWQAAPNYWTQTSTTLYPTNSSKRILIGNPLPTDDTSSALQVAGAVNITGNDNSQIISSDGTLVLGSNKSGGNDGAIVFDFETTAGAALIASTGSGIAVNSFAFGGPSGVWLNADGSIGQGATGGVDTSVVIGKGAGSGDTTSVIIGNMANSGIGIPGSDNTVIGFNASSAGGNDSVAIGYGAYAGGGGSSIAIGNSAQVSTGAYGAIVIGGSDNNGTIAYASNSYSTVIGYGANDIDAPGGITFGGIGVAGVSSPENYMTIMPSGSDKGSPKVTIGLSPSEGGLETSILNVYGDINATGAINPGAGLADVAENYPTKDKTLSAGEIAALDITNSPFVVRANSVNSSVILGIVSTAPGMKLGADKKYKSETQVPIALAGRVPVKVDLEGGAINIGDRIALSTATAGVGMKASAGANTFGIAMESFDGSENANTTTTTPTTTTCTADSDCASGQTCINGFCSTTTTTTTQNTGATGTILVFVQNQQYVLSSSGVVGTGQIAGVGGTTFLQSVNDSLAALGITIKDGIVKIATLAVDSLNVKTARMQEMEIVDSVTGDAYCTWIANGEWQKVEGDCATVGPNVSSVVAPASSTSLTNPNSQTTSIAQAAIDEAQAAAHQAQAAAEQARRVAQQAQHAAQQATQANSSAQNAADQAQNAAESVPLNVSSVAPISDINVAYGADLSGVNLPATITATLSDASTQSLIITWDQGTPTYNANTAGTYVFSGTLTLSGSITNTNNIKAAANVIVAPQAPSTGSGQAVPEVTPPAEEQVPQPISMFGDLIQNSTASFVNSILEFAKWIFGTSAKTVSSLPLIKQATASLMQSADLLQSGLITPISKILEK